MRQAEIGVVDVCKLFDSLIRIFLNAEKSYCSYSGPSILFVPFFVAELSHLRDPVDEPLDHTGVRLFIGRSLGGVWIPGEV